MTWDAVLRTVLGFGNSMERLAILKIRLPRLLMGWMVAIALAHAGGVLQTMTRNSLADTNLLGFNAGAALFAVLYIQSQTLTYYAELGRFAIFVLPLVSILGAGFTALLLFLLAGGKAFQIRRLLLVGLGLQAGLNALILLFSFRGRVGDYNRILIWLSGSLWGTSWLYVIAFLPLLSLTLLLLYRSTPKLDLLLLKDEQAIGLGVPVAGFRIKLYALAVILAGSAVAFAGNIGFIGLLAPHIARKLVGVYHRHFLPIAALVSMVLISISDALARNLFSPIELPVGLIIALMGVPYFIILLLKEK
jgi:iron complex transport system permease protein